MHEIGEILTCIGIFCSIRHLMLFGSALTIAEFWPEEKKEVYMQSVKLLISVVVLGVGHAMCG
ncbi:hypothetical protein RX717_12820 [Intestinibacillus sp. NTUH-41-i26]|uniref:hypothetical protein n=1 Tax=Intestinibacillus sp. NTUH-41-i26 TaxID=3079303 RepID=UPI00293506C6|nr:hypothetical protein [Intestinibacillus sp. NTUH-41-i26]WOC74851.1 hypothetical protein RX717_12820 [Intestinibacillus sp. NTUH-41-i26]